MSLRSRIGLNAAQDLSIEWLTMSKMCSAISHGASFSLCLWQDCVFRNACLRLRICIFWDICSSFCNYVRCCPKQVKLFFCVRHKNKKKIDFSKAFDLVSHDRLLMKLAASGVDSRIVVWVREFLVGRTQRVRVEGQLSKEVRVTSGVPQGSVLGPLFF